MGQGGQWSPPDPNGAVGANNYFEIVNDGFAVYSKTGATVLSARPTNTLWSGFGGNCQSSNNGDGTVVFDHFAQRWVVQQFQISTLPYSDCVAVSTTSDPTGKLIYAQPASSDNQQFLAKADYNAGAVPHADAHAGDRPPARDDRPLAADGAERAASAVSLTPQPPLSRPAIIATPSACRWVSRASSCLK